MTGVQVARVSRKPLLSVPLGLLVLLAGILTACTGAKETPTPTASAPAAATQVVGSTTAATATPPVAATPAATPAATTAARALKAGTATITLDGKTTDWAAVPALEVPLKPIPKEMWGREVTTAGKPVTATLKVANTATTVYVLVTVPDTFVYDPKNHNASPALAVEWAIDAEAGAAMGSLKPDYVKSGGMVDIWHWELDCGPGEMSGGTFPTGDDPKCNLDDEYATLTDEREDDKVQSSLTGSWDHTGRAQGAKAAGTWVFEIARPMNTGDPQDAQFAAGGTARVGIAYWDGDEGRAKDGGWTDTGHVVSALDGDGWIEVTFAK